MFRETGRTLLSRLREQVGSVLRNDPYVGR
jgi:hypothetical protein